MRFALFLLAVGMQAQTTLTLTGPASAKQGTAVSLSLSSGGATANGPAGLQWSLTPPVGVTVSGVTAGASATAASKQVACNAANLLCLVYGVNQNVIANGVVATMTVQIPANANPGPASFPLSGLVAGDKNGVAMTISSGATYSLNVLSRADIDGNGSVTSADVSLMANQVTSGTCTDDQNGDGRCDLLDVLVVVLRAMGL